MESEGPGINRTVPLPFGEQITWNYSYLSEPYHSRLGDKLRGIKVTFQNRTTHVWGESYLESEVPFGTALLPF